MEVAESREQASVGPTTGASSAIANAESNPFLDDSFMDDGRSSSLSEIDDVSDNEPSDFEDAVPSDKLAPDNDSEAETERLEDSPHNIRKRDIVVSANSVGPSPSKLHQSTTVDDVEDEEHVADDSPSKLRRPSRNNGVTEEPSEPDEELADCVSHKRKRGDAGDETGTEMCDEEPLRKRRSSIKSDLSDPIDDDTLLSPEPIEDMTATNDDDTPADDIAESDLPTVSSKTKKFTKGKRKGREVRDMDEETETGDVGAAAEDVADDNLGEDEEPAEAGDEADDAEAAARVEEECMSPPMSPASIMADTLYSCEKDVGNGVPSDTGEGICNVTGQVSASPSSLWSQV